MKRKNIEVLISLLRSSCEGPPSHVNFLNTVADAFQTLWSEIGEDMDAGREQQVLKKLVAYWDKAWTDADGDETCALEEIVNEARAALAL